MLGASATEGSWRYLLINVLSTMSGFGLPPELLAVFERSDSRTALRACRKDVCGAKYAGHERAFQMLEHRKTTFVFSAGSK